MKKEVYLTDTVTDESGADIAVMKVVLDGDGSVPNIMTQGLTVGYHDDGTPILPDDNDGLLKQAHQKMMAAAIKEQKQLTKENGMDPSVVNKYGDEHRETIKPTAQQTLTAGMMKDIATMKIQIAQLTKEESNNAK